MQRRIKSIAKDFGIKGWRFDIEDGDRMYLSKFDPDPEENDDEYRIYFFIKPEGIQVVRRFVIKSYKYKENVPKNHKYVREAEKILEAYFEKHKSNHFDIAS